MGIKLKRVTILLTEEQHEKLRCLAAEKRISMSKLLRDATLEILEDAEDVSEGNKAQCDGEDIVTWKQCQQNRQERECRGEL